MTAPLVDVPPLNIRELRDSLQLSRERMARLLDVSTKTVERWEARDDAPANRHIRQQLAQLQEIAHLGNLLYTPKGLTLFLTTPMPAFDGLTGLQLIEIGQGERVIGELAADYEGLGY